MNLKQFKSPLILLFVILLLWLFSPISFQFSFWKFAGIFGDTADLQNVFAPISALFSGAAVVGAVYAIIIQVKLAQRQQFENTFFNLLSIHKDNAKNTMFPLSLVEDNCGHSGQGGQNYIVGFESFKLHHSFLKQIYTYVFTVAQGATPQSTQLSSDVSLNIDQQIGASSDDNGKTTLGNRELFKLVYDVYTDYTDLYYSSYARHLYHVLKHIMENNPFPALTKTYIRIIRAQLSKYEVALLFYRAIMSPDKDVKRSDCSKYQILIEETAFLHLLENDNELFFDNGFAGHMKKTAFSNHNDTH